MSDAESYPIPGGFARATEDGVIITTDDGKLTTTYSTCEITETLHGLTQACADHFVLSAGSPIG